jgi:hypothetical protein
MKIRLRCPDCFRRVSVEEDQTEFSALDFHRLRGDCGLTEKPPPLKIKVRKNKKRIEIEDDWLDDIE